MNPALFRPTITAGPSACLIQRGPSWMPRRALPADGDGGHEGGDAAAAAAAKAAADKAASDKAAADKAAADKAAADKDRGYPANTRVEDMTPEQKVAYHTFHHRKAEDRLRGMPTDAELVELREKAARAEQLEYDLGTDVEKAVKDATSKATTDATASWLPKVISAHVQGQMAAKGFTAEDIESEVKYLNFAQFANTKGDDVDPEKIADWLKNKAPATGAGGRRTPGTGALGDRQRSSDTPGAAGKAEAARRFAKQNQQGAAAGAR